MKARVKATGEIISLDEKSTVLDTNPCNFNSYEISELEILYENTNFPKDYWEKLFHQYAGMAIGGMCGNKKYNDYAWDDMAKFAIEAARILMEKLKEKKE